MLAEHGQGLHYAREVELAHRSLQEAVSRCATDKVFDVVGAVWGESRIGGVLIRATACLALTASVGDGAPAAQVHPRVPVPEPRQELVIATRRDSSSGI
jgi:hypothetical protein